MDEPAGQRGVYRRLAPGLAGSRQPAAPGIRLGAEWAATGGPNLPKSSAFRWLSAIG